MSSDQNKTTSIRRRLAGEWSGRKLGGIVSSTLLFLLLVPLLFLASLELRELGSLSLKTERRIEMERDADGKINGLFYSAKLPDTEQSLREQILPQVQIFGILCGGLFLLRIVVFFGISLPAHNRKLEEILSPLDELARKADALSRMEFGENKYQRIEDAISQLETDEEARDLLSMMGAPFAR